MENQNTEQNEQNNSDTNNMSDKSNKSNRPGWTNWINRSKYWKFIGGFLGLIILAVIGVIIWNAYFSKQAKYDRQMQKQYEAYQVWEKKYNEALKNDTYGGKTPEETLAMFVDALKKEDLELASKYFVLRTDGSVDPKWKEALEKTKEAELLSIAVNTIPKMVYDKNSSDNNTAWFSFANKEGIAEYSVSLTFNKTSGIWKISSL